MCSYMVIKGPIEKVIKFTPDYTTFNSVIQVLGVKGNSDDDIDLFMYNHNLGELLQLTAAELRATIEPDFEYMGSAYEKFTRTPEDYNDEDIVTLVAFSRLAPEMEVAAKDNTLSQPYLNIADRTITMVHGTIPKAEEFVPGVQVDTDIFMHRSFQDCVDYTELVGGKISAVQIQLTKLGTILGYDNGLGQFEFESRDKKVWIGTNINIFNHLQWWEYMYFTQLRDPYIKPVYPKTLGRSNSRIISLFSGGLDITCSTLQILDNIDDYVCPGTLKSVDLWYFDWGTRASAEEQAAGKLFKDKLVKGFAASTANGNEDFVSTVVNYEVIPTEGMFRNILQACDTTVRLTDKDATGAGHHEAEAAISYVPYRNQFLLTLAAAKAEQLYPGETVIIVIGANLSEGMVYLDNSESFVDAINKTIRVGGQRTNYFEVVAPFVNRTKTEMVAECLNSGFDLSTAFSCYFPVNGKECGTCGSCLLKQRALERGGNK